MTRASVRQLVSLAMLGVASAVFGCADDLSLEGRPCPCTDGWQCCEDADVCVRKASECSLFLSPNVVRLRLGASYQFQRPLVPVTWSVDEPNGGSIDEKGLYRAPLRPGTYHVRVTMKSGAYAAAVVVVGPSKLERLIGQQGGFGTADGIGRDARFSQPANIVGDSQYLYVSDGQEDFSEGCLQYPANSECSSAEDAATCYLARCPAAYGVRRISLATREVTRLAGERFLRHLALDAGALFAATAKPTVIGYYGTHLKMPYLLTEIVRIDPSSGVVTSLAGRSISSGQGTPGDDYEPPRDGVGADARFSGIRGVAADGAGALFVSDDDGNVDPYHSYESARFALRRIDEKTGEVTTLAATAEWAAPSPSLAPFSSLTFLTFHEGSLYGLDPKAEIIWKYDPKTATFTNQYFWKEEPSSSYVGKVTSFCLDRDQLIGVVGRCIKPLSNGEIACKSGTVLSTDAPQFALSVANGLWCDGNGNWYAADTGAPAVLHLSADDPALVEIIAGEPEHAGWDAPSPDMLLSHPTSVAANAAGDIVFAESLGGQRLVHVSPDGQVSTHYSPKLYDTYYGLTLGPDGTVYYVQQAMSGFYEVSRFDLETDTTAVLTGFATWPFLAHDGIDKLYAATCGGDEKRVHRIDSTGSVEVIAKGLCGHLAVDGQKRVFVADSGTFHAIDLATGEATPISPPGQSLDPMSLAYDPAGLLYFASGWNYGSSWGRDPIRGLIVDTGEIFDVVGKLGSQGVQLGPLPASLNTPSGIALLPDGSLAITDSAENVLLVAQ